MPELSWSESIIRRKERALSAAAVLVTVLMCAASLSGWLREESWGRPITVRTAGGGDVPALTLPDFSKVWEEGGKNPFGYAGATLETGGKARIPFPPLPPLAAEFPPAPMVRPIDLLTETVQ